MELGRTELVTEQERADMDARRFAYDERLDVIRSERGLSLKERTQARGKRAINSDEQQQSLEETS